MKFAPLTSIAKTCLPVLLIAGVLALTSPMPNAVAQEKILVATLNGEAIYLDEVMRLVEKLPDEILPATAGNLF